MLMTRWILPFFDVNTACCLVPRWCIFRRLDYLVDTIQQILARPPLALPGTILKNMLSF